MQINLSLGFIAYLISTLLFLGLLIVTFIGQKQFAQGKPFYLLVIATLIWSGLMTMSQIEASIAFEMVFIAELLRYYTWFYVLSHSAGNLTGLSFNRLVRNPISPLYTSVAMIVSVVMLIFNQQIVDAFEISNINLISTVWLMLFSVSGIILTEQLYRNTAVENRGAIIYLCISAGAIFIFDFYVFSDAILVGVIDYELWSSRGIINVLITPTLMIAAARNPSLAPRVHISREFVFHSTALFGAGAYLVLMSLAGYYIKKTSGDWGELFQAVFLFAALLLFASLFMSSRIKSRVKHYINKSFSNKYDYRSEWNRFSNTLLNAEYLKGTPFKTRSLIAICQIFDCEGGHLFSKDGRAFKCSASWNAQQFPDAEFADDSAFIQHLKKHRDIQSTTEVINNNVLEINHPLFVASDSWMLMPLWVEKQLLGFVHLLKPHTGDTLDAEDKELLTTVSNQVALFLAQQDAAHQLQQSEKFKSMNQMTAFLTHDLKTLLSQLSLLVENGKIHKQNPEFIEDMLNTLEHVVQKMNKLVQQLKEPKTDKSSDLIKLNDVLDDIITDYQHHSVIPAIDVNNLDVFITGDQSELRSALKHIIQNAVDSVGKSGRVDIHLNRISAQLAQLVIQDTGEGMDDDFIQNQLFQPFESTKGVSGMGIGAYQSREYIRSLGGDIHVNSTPGKGSEFIIDLPLTT